jgi:hypothetical protein
VIVAHKFTSVLCDVIVTSPFPVPEPATRGIPAACTGCIETSSYTTDHAAVRVAEKTGKLVYNKTL